MRTPTNRTAAVLLGRVFIWSANYLAWRGLAGLPLMVAHRIRHRLARHRYTVSDPVLGNITLRPRSADLHVFSQVVISGEYTAPPRYAAVLRSRIDAVLAQGRKPLIIDGGGNIGLVARAFATEFPMAQVVCVEPDAANHALAIENTRTCPNVTVLRAALWSHDTVLDLEDGSVDTWAYKYGETATASGDNRVDALSIDSLIARFPGSDLVLLKLDIEGAEKQALHADAHFWSLRPILYVEPHDWFDGQSGSLTGLLRQPGYHDADWIISGENILVFPKHPAAPPA